MENEIRLQIKTIYGRLLTIKVQEQNSDYISGIDKFGYFVKIPIKDIYSAEPVKEVHHE
jgi:hypothetical protein